MGYLNSTSFKNSTPDIVDTNEKFINKNNYLKIDPLMINTIDTSTFFNYSQSGTIS